MTENKKLSPKAALEAKTDALVAELQAIRTHIANKRASTATPEELADLQSRLFEVWVAEKVALATTRQEQTTASLEAAKQELAELHKHLAALAKEVVRLGKLNDKLTSKVASLKPAPSRKR